MANSYLVGVTLKAYDQASSVIAAVSRPVAGLQVALKGAADSAKTFDERWGAVAATGQRVGMAMVGIGAATVGALGMAGRKAAEYGDEISHAADRTGMAVPQLTALKFAAEQSGVGFDGLQRAIGLQAKGAYAAMQGTGPAAEAYKKLGMSVTDANGVLKDGHTLFLETADALAGVANPTERAALAMALFGRGGRAMLPMLSDGAAGILKLEEQAKSLGLVLDGDTAEKMHKASKTMEASGLMIGASWRSVGATVAPSLAVIAVAGAKAFQWLTSSTIGKGALAVGATLAILTGIVGTGILTFIGLARAYTASQAAMLAFGETQVGMVVATKLIVLWQGLQALSVNGIVAALGRANAAILANGTLTVGMAGKSALATAGTWLLAAAQTGLAGTMAVVSAAARIMWAAISGPIGWIIGAVIAVGAGIYALVHHHNAAKKAADDQAASLKKVGEDGVAAEEGVADAATAAAEAQQKAADAAVTLEDAQRTLNRAQEDQPRIQRDVAKGIQDAADAQDEASKGIATQERDSAEKVADAQTKVGDARREAEKQARDSGRAIEDAARNVGDAEQAAADRTAAAAETVEKAFDREKKAAKSVEDARVKGAKSIRDAEASAADRKASAERRLGDALNKQAGIELTPEQQNARDVADAQAELVKAQNEGTVAVSEARQQAIDDVAKAEDDLKVARDESRKAAVDLDTAILEGKRAIADAERALSDARIAAAEAQTAAAGRVLEAEKALGKAREEQDKGREDALKRYKDAQEGYNKAVEESGRKLEDAALAVLSAARALEAAKKGNTEAQAGAQTAAAAAQTAAADAGGAGGGAAQDTGGGLKGTAERIIRDPKAPWWKKAWARSVMAGAGVSQSMTGDLAGGLMTTAGAFGSSDQLPGRALGGPVSAGVAYWVGENGRERFIPATAGQIVPMPSAGGAGSTIVQNFNFNGPIYGEQGIREVAQQEFQKAGRAMAYAR